MLLVVKLGCFWHWYFWWNFFVMLTVLFYSSWGHWHKDNFEELGAQERNLWLQLHGPLWSISGKTWVPAAPTGIAMDRLVRSGLWCRWFRENMQKTLCPMHAAITHLHWHFPQLAHVSTPGWSLENRLLPETFPQWTGGSQGSPCRVVGMWEREVFVTTGWLPSPLSRHWASFSSLPSRL